MSTATRTSTDRAVGALLGAAVGDALGWPQEVRGGLVGGQRARDRLEPKPQFVAWTRSAGYYARRYPDRVEPGEYSDDTQLLLAVARACLAGRDWYERLTLVELPTWPLYQRGGGGAVLSATGSWADLLPPWVNGASSPRAKVAARYAGAGANGVAMRIAPHVIHAPADAELFDRILRDGLATHGHPRALVGALVYASALRAALDATGQLSFGELIDAGRAGLIPPERALSASSPQRFGGSERDDFARTWGQTNYETDQLLATAEASIRRGAMSNSEATLEALGCTNPKVNGAGTVSAVAALYVASRYAARPMNGLVSAAFLRKGDTDTLASMTGALLGAVHGKDWLGEMAHTVQDSDYIAGIATALAENTQGVPPAPPAADSRPLRERWRQAARKSRAGETGTFPDGRAYRVMKVEALPSASVTRVRLRFDDGQTILHDFTETWRNEMQPTFDDSLASGSAGESRTEQTASAREGLFERPPAELVAVTALTNNLRRTVAFYARLLGRDIAVRGDEADITEWFRLRQSAHEVTLNDATTMAVTLHIANPDALARRLASLDFDTSPSLSSMRDPDGRIVRLERG